MKFSRCRQDNTHVVLKDGILFRKSSKNNIPIRTGKEFSMEFLEECRLGRQPCNGNGKVLSTGTMLSKGLSDAVRGILCYIWVVEVDGASLLNDFVSSMAHQAIRVSEVKVPSNGMMLSNRNHHMAHEEVSAMLGL
ncbi:hypothetical protein Tco_0359767 [Tanacetum coccineum]